VQSYNISGPNPGPEQIGATIYQNSIGFTCYSSSPSYIDYNVAGHKFLNAPHRHTERGVQRRRQLHDRHVRRTRTRQDG
jgi:hypothetical protein